MDRPGGDYIVETERALSASYEPDDSVGGLKRGENQAGVHREKVPQGERGGNKEKT